MAIFLMIMLLFCTGCTHNEESSNSDQSSEVEQADISITDSGTYYDYAYGSDPLQRLDLVIPEENWEQKVSDVREFKVDTFVMGNDWEGKFDFLKEYCDVVYLPRTPDISTTQIKDDLGR